MLALLMRLYCSELELAYVFLLVLFLLLNLFQISSRQAAQPSEVVFWKITEVMKLMHFDAEEWVIFQLRPLTYALRLCTINPAVNKHERRRNACSNERRIITIIGVYHQPFRITAANLKRAPDISSFRLPTSDSGSRDH